MELETVEIRLNKHVAAFLQSMPPERVIAVLQEAAMIRGGETAKAPSKPILQRANELIGGDRQDAYGNKLQNQAQIAMLMQGYLAPKLRQGQVLTPEDACNLLICVKLARLSKQPDHEDSLLDIAGYVGVEEALQLERGQPREYPLYGATVDAREKKPGPIGIWPPYAETKSTHG